MKATSLLKKQHSVVKAIFKKLEGGRGDSAALVSELADNLCAHMAIEQDIFYPAIREVDEDLVGESFEEHSVAELSLKRLLATPPGDKAFKARVTTLKELIEHHVKEEENDLFPEVEKAMGAELSALGAKMKVEFEAALEKGHATALSKVFAVTTADAAIEIQRSGGRRARRPSGGKRMAARRSR